MANAVARRALVAKVASEKPAAIFIGGDLVYEGSNPEDYEIYRTETAAWSQAKIPIFPALGNHEFRGCDKDLSPCLVNWWRAAVPSGSALLPLVLRDSRAEDPGTRYWTQIHPSSPEANNGLGLNSR